MYRQFTVDNKKFYFLQTMENNFLVKSSPHNYNVTINHDNISSNFIELAQDQNNYFLIDTNVYNLYFKNINFCKNKLKLVIATEEEKTIVSVLNIIDWLEQNKFTKLNRLIVVGGGISQDIGAFIGACYKRGIQWSFFPTTLLSMCDSCIGGKTGINYKNAKNQLALFSAPSNVFININFLKTLSKNDILSGMGEIIKLYVTGGMEDLDLIKSCISRDGHIKLENFSHLITTSLAIKKSVIEFDEFENLHRKCLNYGHTIGHALESATNFKIPHGIAVAIGILTVNQLALQHRFIEQAEVESIRASIAPLLREIHHQYFNYDIYSNSIRKDKKNIGNTAIFVMIHNRGVTFFHRQELSDEFISRTVEVIKREVELCQA